MDLKELRKKSFTSAREFFQFLSGNVPKAYLQDVDTLIHFDIEGAGGGQFSVLVRDNEMTVKEEFSGDPTCTITAKEKHFLSLLSGEMNPMIALFTGKIKISNPGEIMKYAKVFGLI